MTAQQLSYAIAVADCQSFSKAAESCFVTQPTLSAQIQKLEHELGIKLFNRGVKPVQTTELGQRVIAEGRRVLSGLTQIVDLIKEETDGLAGELRIGVIPTLAPYLLPLFIRQFGDAYPRIRLVITERLSEDIVTLLTQGRLDLGLLATTTNQPQLEEQILFQEPLMAYVAASDPLAKRPILSLEDLQSGDLLLLAEGNCLRDQVIQLCQSNTAASPLFDGSSLATIMRLVESGFGYTILPELAVRGLSSDRRSLVRPLAKPVARQVRLVSHRTFSRQRVRESFAQLIIAAVTEASGLH